MGKQPARILIGLILIIAIGVALMNMFTGAAAFGLGSRTKELSLSSFYKELDNDQIINVKWQQATLTGQLANGGRYAVKVVDRDSPAANDIAQRIGRSKVNFEYEDPPVLNSIVGFLGAFILPVLLIAMIWFLVLRPAQMGGNQALNFGRSRAKRVGETGPKVTFEDVAGIDEAKQELFEIVDFLRNTKKYAALGAKIPKGILLTGPPGVGKTYIARAVAGEAGVPFFHISGSDFVEMFVGVGAARVRDLFETAKAHRPSLIFVDEIDAVGRQRGAGLGGGHDEREQTLNQLLVEMDGFDPNSGVILIAATNRPDVLDPALLRPGRFDRQIVVDAPDAKGRESILRIHGKGKPVDSDVQYDTLAKLTPGFTGADLANMLNEAALIAARNNKAKIGMPEIEEARDRVTVGAARRSRKLNQKEREVTAYHEAGHAIIGELLEHSDPIHKVTILPRGRALGITWSLPDIEKYTSSRSELMDDITMLLGGLVAEEVVYGERWTGAGNDLERVTAIARAMVCQFGMSDKLGTLAIGRRHVNPFLGRDYNEDRNYSEEVAKQIDEEVRKIVDESHGRAREILTTHRAKMDRLVAALLERETLGREEFLAV
ncbi:MAG: ATP-dependent zinc metalloprotease FtsH, partial [Fimbriimonadaceae bacterium]|nr:ATP-dependent zinc metalloprotease FtsH [Fimbriimonadaceae bacterium]